MPKSRISYLFPPDRVHDLPTWRFVLHFRAPIFLAGRALRKAVERLEAAEWKVISFSCSLRDLAISSRTHCVPIPVEVAEGRRRQPNALAEYESDVWRMWANMIECGFGELVYEAVDWQEEA